ncbi:MAG: hypothetical protein ACI4OJ_02320 [Lachnospiraceae bacterium]
MKKRFVCVLMTGILGAALMTGCGGSGDTSAEAVSTAAAAEADTEEVVTTEAAEEETTEEETTEADTEETASSDEVTYVDGYYANDGNGNDFIIAFFEGAAGDVAYISDGTNEALAEYTVEEAQTDSGTDYYLITVGDTALGYYTDGSDYYLVDANGNIYTAAALSEDEAVAIYSAIQMADSGEVDNEEADATDVTYVDGYYANDGNGNDFIIAFYSSSAGDIAYVNDGTQEVFAEYSVSDAETSDGTPYYLISIGNTALGYATDGEDYYIIDTDGNVYAAAALSEEEADLIYNALQEAE